MYLFSKRVFDILMSLLAIVLTSPVMLLAAFLIKLESQGPVFYRGKRAGLHGEVLYIFKFRTMVVDAEKVGGFSTALNDSRLTKIGRFLRRYKIDELPQFFNVLVGDMSLVGPRPQVFFYADKYIGENKLILSVKPGITDLASIYFINMDKTLGNIDVDKKYESEVEPIKNNLRIKYIKERSFFLDLRILVETVFGMVGINNITGLNITT